MHDVSKYIEKSGKKGEKIGPNPNLYWQQRTSWVGFSIRTHLAFSDRQPVLTIDRPRRSGSTDGGKPGRGGINEGKSSGKGAGTENWQL